MARKPVSDSWRERLALFGRTLLEGGSQTSYGLFGPSGSRQNDGHSSYLARTLMTDAEQRRLTSRQRTRCDYGSCFSFGHMVTLTHTFDLDSYLRWFAMRQWTLFGHGSLTLIGRSSVMAHFCTTDPVDVRFA